MKNNADMMLEDLMRIIKDVTTKCQACSLVDAPAAIETVTNFLLTHSIDVSYLTGENFIHAYDCIVI